MAFFENGGTVWAGFRSPDGGDEFVASATVFWDDNLCVTVSDVKYSTYVECKWRVRPFAGGSPLAGYDGDNYLGDTFYATENVQYVFQACVAGPGGWGNSIKNEGTDGSSYFTVRHDSGGGGSGGDIDTPDIYAIVYDANGGTGAPITHFKTEGEVVYLSLVEPIKDNELEDTYVVTLDANGGESSVKSLNADRIKYFTFGYWNTRPDGSGTTYHPGGSYTYDAPLALYAIYLEDIVTQSVELPIAGRGGYEFLGWSTDQNATAGITGVYEPSGDVVLYAIWYANGLLYIFDGVEFCAYQVFIYDGASWGLYCPYVYDSGWSLCS